MRVIIALAATLLLSSPAIATMTIVSVSGDSAQDLSRTAETTPTIYGGIVNRSGSSVCTGDGNFTCDSCVEAPSSTMGSGLLTCNQRSAYPNLKLNIVLRSTSAITVANAFAKSDTRSIPGAKFAVPGDGTLRAIIPWGGLCEVSGAGANCATAGARTLDLEVGADISGGGVDSAKMKVVLKISDSSDSKYTDCPVTASPGDGYCFFQIYPGDAKLIATELVVSDDYPSTGYAGVDFTKLVFFYEEQLPSESDFATLERISNASPMVLLQTGINNGEDPENRITGLRNEVRYCVAMANQDKTGIISRMTPLVAANAAQYCETPSQVVGLLDDKSCFIATAAFGSDMAPEVQSFREFRNEYLLTHSWGRSFVKFYYAHSPYYAQWIAEKPMVKAVVRAALWPLLLFAKVSMVWGFSFAFMILFGSLVLGYQAFKSIKYRMSYRGEA